MSKPRENPMLKEESEDSENSPLDYISLTSKRDREEDIYRINGSNKAVFPELKSPFDHFYVKFRDLNSDRKSIDDEPSGNWRDEDRRAHPAVEVGVKFTF